MTDCLRIMNNRMILLNPNVMGEIQKENELLEGEMNEIDLEGGRGS